MQHVMPNPLVTIYQAQLAVSKRLADALFAGTQKLDRVMIDASHRAFNEQLDFAHAIATGRAPQTVGAALQSGFLAHSPDGAVNDQKEIMRIAIEIQDEIGRSLQDYMEQLGSHVDHNAVKSLLGASQARATDASFSPMTSMFSIWESAFKEMRTLAGKNMSLASASVEDVTGKETKTAGNYADVTIDTTTGPAADMAATVPSGSDDDKHKPSSAGHKRK